MKNEGYKMNKFACLSRAQAALPSLFRAKPRAARALSAFAFKGRQRAPVAPRYRALYCWALLFAILKAKISGFRTKFTAAPRPPSKTQRFSSKIHCRAPLSKQNPASFDQKRISWVKNRTNAPNRVFSLFPYTLPPPPPPHTI
jgi:hypothetical protein